MILDPPRRPVAWLATSSLFFCSIIHAQQVTEPKTPQSSVTTPDLNSANSLSRLLNDMLVAGKNDDRETLRSQIEDMEIPNCERWFMNALGQEVGEHMAALYEKWREKNEQDFMELFLYLAHQEGEISVQKADFARVYVKPLVRPDAYWADWVKTGSHGWRERRAHRIRIFVHFYRRKVSLGQRDF